MNIVVHERIVQQYFWFEIAAARQAQLQMIPTQTGVLACVHFLASAGGPASV